MPGPARRGGDGFGSGLLVGASLGFVYAPCAGPILAGVITVSAAQDFTVGRLAVALAYSLGSAAVLYVLMLGGRRVTDRLGAYRGRIQIAMGAVMVAVAALMIANLDVRFENTVARHLPSALVDPTSRIEQSSDVASGLADLRGGGPVAPAGAPRRPPPGRGSRSTSERPTSPGRSSGSTRLTAGRSASSDLRGQVVLVDFWTYTCINCIRTLPYIEAWYRKYHRDGFTVVGVHTPEFPFEKDASNVERAIGDFGLTYPVAQDNDYATWTAYRNQYWPADYLIDATGRVRSSTSARAPTRRPSGRSAACSPRPGRPASGHGQRPRADAPTRTRRPESYLGAARAARFANGPILPGPQAFRRSSRGRARPRPARLRRPVDDRERGGNGGTSASLELDFNARRVFLVLGSPGRPRTMRVLLDGRPIPDGLAGPDVHGGVATISTSACTGWSTSRAPARTC